MKRRPQGFAPRDKVRHSADYARIKAEGKTVRGRHLILRTLENGLPLSRLGRIVSRKHGPAVARNRLRRRLREIFRRNREQFPAGLDVVVIPIGGAAALPFSGLQEEFLALAGRLAKGAK